MDIREILKIAEGLRKKYPEGTTVRLVKMEDKQAPPIGTTGVVDFVDDMATIFVRWSTGSHLGVVYGSDVIETVK